MVQRMEWLPGDAFPSAKARYNIVQQCAMRDGKWLAAWTIEAGIMFGSVYVAKRPPVPSGEPQADAYHWPLGSALSKDPDTN